MNTQALKFKKGDAIVCTHLDYKGRTATFVRYAYRISMDFIWSDSGKYGRGDDTFFELAELEGCEP